MAYLALPLPLDLIAVGTSTGKRVMYRSGFHDGTHAVLPVNEAYRFQTYRLQVMWVVPGNRLQILGKDAYLPDCCRCLQEACPVKFNIYI